MPIGSRLEQYYQSIWKGENDLFSFDMAPWYGRRGLTSSGITVASSDPATLAISTVGLSDSQQAVSWRGEALRAGNCYVILTGTAEGSPLVHIVRIEIEVGDPNA